MPNSTKQISETAIRIGEVRFGYVNVFVPRKSDDDSPEKYGAQISWDKSNTATTNLFIEAQEAAIKEGITSKWDGKRPAKLKLPLRDGDEEYPGDPLYEGKWFVNCSSNKDNKPGVAMIENGQYSDALDSDDFYSGCYGCASIRLYPYNTKGNRGVAVGLNNVLKTRDGEKLSGGHSAQQDFADLVGDMAGLLD